MHGETVKFKLDRSGLGHGQMAGLCEHVDRPSGFVKCGEFLC